MEFIEKNELIDKIYDTNSQKAQPGLVNVVYFYDDGKYTLRVVFGTNSWNSCRIAIWHNQTHSLITEVYYDTQSKITKKDAKNIADFAFLAWNTRERKIK
ncbi:MAG: hypothetical protein SPE49_08350 [Campylobacter sp.]|uniref:hypothetical protein n=1 Tax=Campylobacter sp. TaxID=205 RepID=UPI002A817B20|nr:hypothetical protein [Campylobacter sp.]MCI7586427.1 hypothetical protein [Campylobacter sp.]MDY5115958.1 hypothetical protein [Campylobacter sp.]